MDQEQQAQSSGKWYSRLTVLFAVIFAIFWSLGPFFFWMPFGLTLYFAFLWIYSSGVKFTVFDRKPPPYRPREFRSQPEADPVNSGQPVDVVQKVRRIVRVIFIFFGGLILFFFVIGIFSDGPEETGEAVRMESTDESTEPKDPVTLLTDKGNVAYGNQNYDSALYFFEKALKLQPDNKVSQYNIAVVYSSKKEYRKSNTLVRKSVRMDPEYNDGWWLLGWNYFQINSYDSAFVSLDRAYVNQFKNPDFLALMGDVSMKKSNRIRAMEAYKACLEQDSTRVDVYEMLAQLEPEKADWYRKKAKDFQ